MTADELAQMVLDREDPNKVNLSHSAFNHKREHWDKILTTKTFDKMPDTEKVKLLMCHPGSLKASHSGDGATGRSGTECIEEFRRQAICPLEFNLPKLIFLDEKSRCVNKISEFVVLSQLQYDAQIQYDVVLDADKDNADVSKSAD